MYILLHFLDCFADSSLFGSHFSKLFAHAVSAFFTTGHFPLLHHFLHLGQLVIQLLLHITKFHLSFALSFSGLTLTRVLAHLATMLGDDELSRANLEFLDQFIISITT